MKNNNQNNQNKKKDFIGPFLEAVFDFSKGFVQAFARESWYYKDLRIGGFDPNKIYGNTKNLKRRGILRSDGGGNFRFTKYGLTWAQQMAKKHFPQHKKWDSKWRIVIFDIPQELHYARIKFGRKLKNLGFFMLQKSVFVFPYPCTEELGNICADMEISDYVDVIVAEDVGFKADELKKHYSLH